MFWAERKKKRFCDGQKYNMFWKRPEFLEVSVSSFADWYRAFDKKVQKNIKKKFVFEVSVWVYGPFLSILTKENTHTLIH